MASMACPDDTNFEHWTKCEQTKRKCITCNQPVGCALKLAVFKRTRVLLMQAHDDAIQIQDAEKHMRMIHRIASMCNRRIDTLKRALIRQKEIVAELTREPSDTETDTSSDEC